tara:strand:+ start:227 stop:754 length:528 start_codon:yes stop_codon:yes gene_type:complete
MPLLYISLNYDDPPTIRNINEFTIELPNEIPSQMVRVKDATIVLAGQTSGYATKTSPPDGTGNIQTEQKPLTRFADHYGTRLFVAFKDTSILNSRQILSKNSSQYGKIPLPMNYSEGRPKVQYHYLEQEIHIHTVDRRFNLQVFLNDGITPAPFGVSNTNQIERVDFVIEYDDVN